MAIGPHAAAPRGALCFPTDVPGEVYWDDEAMANAEELPPPPPEPVQYPYQPPELNEYKARPAAAAPKRAPAPPAPHAAPPPHAPAGNKHG